MDVQEEVEKKMTIETKLLAGFIIVYIVAGAIPGLVTYVIDHFIEDGIFSDTMIGLIIFCVLLIAISIIVNYLMKWITTPVRKLSKAAEQMVAGDLNVDLEVESSSELQSISNSLERMKSSLKIAHDWLGPPEIEKYKPPETKFGIGLNEKVIIGMILFLILNPLAATLSHMLYSGSAFISSLISISFSIILLSLIANYLYQQIIKPLYSLANYAERVSKGDYSEMERLEYSGDFGRLERNLTLISERIKRAMKELDMDG